MKRNNVFIQNIIGNLIHCYLVASSKPSVCRYVKFVLFEKGKHRACSGYLIRSSCGRYSDSDNNIALTQNRGHTVDGRNPAPVDSLIW